MNTLKNILFFGLLLAVLCGVYLSLNRAPEAPVPPGLSADTSRPNIEIPGLNGAPITNISSVPDSGNIPSLPPHPPEWPLQPTAGGGIAPPFVPPTAAGTSGGSLQISALTPPPAPPDWNRAPPALPAPPSDLHGEVLNSSNSPPPPQNLAASASASAPRWDPPVAVQQPDPSALAKIELMKQEVRADVEKNDLDKALMNLSLLYDSPDLPPLQGRAITEILDQLAAKVIYSREHLLENAYLVRTGDTLDGIADRYKVPAMLLAKINGIRDPQDLPPGRELKVLKGPFSAHISTDRSEMTMMLGGRYAGRFKVRLSDDLSRASGMFTVRNKSTQDNVAGMSMGRHWIELTNAGGDISVYMQAANDMQAAAARDRNNSHTIWLNEQDMDDVFAILSHGSNVIIQQR